MSGIVQELLYIMLRAPSISIKVNIYTGISVDYRNPWMVTMEGRQDYSSMSMKRALGSIIKKCQESSNDVILSSQRDLKQFCSLNHVNLMSALMYPLSSQLIIVMALKKIYLSSKYESLCL